MPEHWVSRVRQLRNGTHATMSSHHLHRTS
ncbi:hypothetical protein PBI_CHIDIEBERE_76 [Gordonia phage Chidiebere]|uniref:Uncharacterized protein n=1 Tax=Gordonia phage Chidiebere TaxID=2656530 RepID=A0A649VKX2_9CAUD|nr:hypothetical protein PQD14_gp076 [Gordonia phage Chidiebere]QGJ93017.1 hypothetical protein PBI_CHIDIEBERE_76 [Gordonia phage Chidiebere]